MVLTKLFLFSLTTSVTKKIRLILSNVLVNFCPLLV